MFLESERLSSISQFFLVGQKCISKDSEADEGCTINTDCIFILNLLAAEAVTIITSVVITSAVAGGLFMCIIPFALIFYRKSKKNHELELLQNGTLHGKVIYYSNNFETTSNINPLFNS
eukprot:TRINITY_DN780_c2_g1_i1.p1 TRINITY_DN780_c2_g1~~TRINITY_DN780_c2_g1_i1.p1  ORF type:complete len:119 (-),score=30.97 TRINITY_DN780_c2_g1_i1:3-359(-)